MTKAVLLKLLEPFADDLEIILQKDPEGNGYSALAGAESVVYRDFDGEINCYDPGWSADDCCLDDDEWDELKAKPRGIVLWPER